MTHLKKAFGCLGFDLNFWLESLCGLFLHGTIGPCISFAFLVGICGHLLVSTMVEKVRGPNLGLG